MTYIVLDLEWDSTFLKSEQRFINQILQIGAVKLDGNFDIADTFEQTVKSSISNRVSKRFTALTGITKEEMLSGIPLKEAVKRFNDFVGDNAVIMTWSTSDLYAVVENEKSLLSGYRFKIENYLDLQSFVQNELKAKGVQILSQISLADAAEKIGVKTEEYDLHTAKDDSEVCANILKKLYNEKTFSSYIKDTSKDRFFDRIAYKPTYIENIESPLIDKNELIFPCDVCGKSTTRKSKWHYKNHCFFTTFKCDECERKFGARISFKKGFDGLIIKKKTYDIKKKEPKEIGEKV